MSTFVSDVGTRDPTPNEGQGVEPRREVLSDGRVVVADAGSAEIRYFDAGGQFLTSFGREGDGPGEFRMPSRVRRLTGEPGARAHVELIRGGDRQPVRAELALRPRF